MAQSVEELTHSPADSEAPVVDKEGTFVIEPLLILILAMIGLAIYN